MKKKKIEHISRSSSCSGCEIRQETIEFLRDQLRLAQQQNDQLQNKLLALTGDAADRYQKLRMMELASQNAPAMNGVLPIGMMEDKSDRDEIDTFVDELHGVLTRRES